ILAKHKKFILWTLLVISILVVTYSLIVEELWTSQTDFIVQFNTNNSNIMSSFMNLNVSNLFSSSGGQSETISILSSRNFAEKIIDRFKLIDHYEIEEEDKYLVKELIYEIYLTELLEVSQDMETGIIKLRVKTKDRFLSAKIANSITDELERYNTYLRMTKGKQEREFLEKRLSELNDEILNLTEEISKFQQSNKVLSIDQQILPLIENYSSLISDYLQNDIKLKYSLAFLDSNNVLISELSFKQDEMLKKIREIEYGSTGIFDYQLSLGEIPELYRQSSLYEAKIEVLKKTYSFIYPQLESAKLQELRDTPTIQIIDKAVPSGRRTWPRRGILCIVTFIISVIILCLIAILIELWQMKLLEDPNIRHKYAKFRKEILFRKK
ncbi:MAG: hypothetical protein KAH05_04795, partial [Clostridiales bacterium]|nr:hypothetical protein [Clostridiales bacterium]